MPEAPKSGEAASTAKQGARAWDRSGYSLAAMRDLARRALPRPVFDFADGGAEDEYLSLIHI